MVLFSRVDRKQVGMKIACLLVAFCFSFTFVVPEGVVCAQAMSSTVADLPPVGTMVPLSDVFAPAVVKGLTIHPDNPLEFDFIIDTGDSGLTGERLRKESVKLIKYFLSALTIPDDEMWVNLSPYQKNKIAPESFSKTDMGRDLLAQDYLLKQLTASMIYPENELGKKFWDKVYAKAKKLYGVTDIPMNTFNKVWIVADRAVVYEKDNTAYVVDSHLKVMMEEDYIALQKNLGNDKFGMDSAASRDVSGISKLSADVMREVVLPELEKEVNEGKNFARLRQVYNSVILASWYKDNLRRSLLSQVYVNKEKLKGVEIEDKDIAQKIYNQYLEAFKKGVYNYIKEEYDENTKQVIPRKYFSGGTNISLKGKLRDLKSIAVTAEDRRLIEDGLKPSSSNSKFFKTSVKLLEIGPNTALTDSEIAELSYEVKGPVSSSAKEEEPVVLSREVLESLPEVVIDNINAGVIFSPKHLRTIKLLSEIGEADLMKDWDKPGVNDEKKRSFLDSVARYNSLRSLKEYKQTAKRMLHQLKNEENPFEGFFPEVPQVDDFSKLDAHFIEAAKLGLQNIGDTVFALVAGGLGTRLGYSSGPKIQVPLEEITSTTYAKLFIGKILAMQKAWNAIHHSNKKIPLVIMTSDENHSQTLEFLKENNYFGMDGLSVVDVATEKVVNKNGRLHVVSRDGRHDKGLLKQIIVMKQDMVPAMKGYDAKFFVDEKDKYKLKVLPHNHGDIHILMAQSGLAEAFKEIGKKYTIFFQDTNGEAFNAILPGLGNSIEKGYKMNFLTIRRQPGSKVGAIAKMVNYDDGREMTFNIEYSMLDGLLRAVARERGEEEKGDVADETGFSPYPGNMNVFILEQDTYVQKLNETGGIFAEIVNPKPDTLISRLEAPMQDIAQYLRGDEVGATNFDSDFVFAPAKNGLRNALIAVAKGVFPESLPTVENVHYRNNRLLFKLAGMDVDVEGQIKYVFAKNYIVEFGKSGKVRVLGLPGEEKIDVGEVVKSVHVKGVPYSYGAKIIFSPNFALLPNDVKQKVKGGRISARSVLVINGENVKLEDVDIDGTLIINTAKGVDLTIKGLSVRNAGWEFVPLKEEDWNNPDIPEEIRMRGYRLVKHEAKVINIREPGVYEVGKDGEVVKVADVSEEEIASTSNNQESQGLEKKNIPVSSSTQPPGGIDLNPALLDLQIKRDDNGIPLPVSQQPLNKMNIQGFVPVITNIVPIQELMVNLP